MAGEVALARKESAHRGQSLLGLAKVLRAEMPHTLARLRDGTLNEFRATIVARESACLERDHRTLLDHELCAEPARPAGVGTRELAGKLRRRVAELDPAAVARRARRAEAERRVTLRPAPDTMTYLTALLSVAQGVAAFAALKAAAATARATGDHDAAERGEGQLMADLLLARLTGLPDTGTSDHAPAVPLTIDITLPAATLAGGHHAALLTAPGVAGEVLPAETARLLAAHALDTGVGAWFRQLYASPTGRLVALTSRQRTFPAGLADLLRIQGHGVCATPWCDAPIKHLDHIAPHADGGPTTHTNGHGLCEACNHAKQAHWHQQPTPPGQPPGIATTTSTGHTYRATAPAPPGRRPPDPRLDASWGHAVRLDLAA